MHIKIKKQTTTIALSLAMVIYSYSSFGAESAVTVIDKSYSPEYDSGISSANKLDYLNNETQETNLNIYSSETELRKKYLSGDIKSAKELAIILYATGRSEEADVVQDFYNRNKFITKESR